MLKLFHHPHLLLPNLAESLEILLLHIVGSRADFPGFTIILVPHQPKVGEEKVKLVFVFAFEVLGKLNWAIHQVSPLYVAFRPIHPLVLLKISRIDTKIYTYINTQSF